MEKLAPEIFVAAGRYSAAVGEAGRGVAARGSVLHLRPRVGSPHILDPQALAEHVDGLYRAAWALCGSREDAEDLVQETFARVLARPRVIRGEDLWYLMRVLRNTFLNSRRDASRRPIVAASLDGLSAADPNERAQPEQAVEAQQLYATIATLPDDFRLALVAVDLLGLSYKEAARALGTREPTVTTRLFRARRAVVKKLEGQPSGSAAKAPGGDARSHARAVPERELR